MSSYEDVRDLFYESGHRLRAAAEEGGCCWAGGCCGRAGAHSWCWLGAGAHRLCHFVTNGSDFESIGPVHSEHVGKAHTT